VILASAASQRIEVVLGGASRPVYRTARREPMRSLGSELTAEAMMGENEQAIETPYAMVARLARVLLTSGREHYLNDAIAEAFVKLPLDDLPEHPTKADYRAAAALVRL
jgi:hypothetical protein